MKRTWTIIGVNDVRASFKWYQSGNGLLLFFRVDEFDLALQRARGPGVHRLHLFLCAGPPLTS